MFVNTQPINLSSTVAVATSLQGKKWTPTAAAKFGKAMVACGVVTHGHVRTDLNGHVLLLLNYGKDKQVAAGTDMGMAAALVQIVGIDHVASIVEAALEVKAVDAAIYAVTAAQRLVVEQGDTSGVFDAAIAAALRLAGS